ncbi:MAG: enoyl-CoA hydratase-related protein [Chloroflexi bacterium]|nr:enoyl-CoA hydratase-related protein [Chloroflexota bacterium]
MVNRVVPRQDLLATAQQMAERIRSMPPLAVRKAKEAITRGSNMSLNEGMDLERWLAMSVLSSDEAVEAFRKH